MPGIDDQVRELLRFARLLNELGEAQVRAEGRSLDDATFFPGDNVRNRDMLGCKHD